MLRNYLLETDLAQLEPEYIRYLWSSQTDFSGFKTMSEMIVKNDFVNRGYSAKALRPDLMLRTSTDTISASSTGTAFEDLYSRTRLAYNVTERTGTTSLVLQGSTDNSAWVTIETQSITATGEGSFFFIEGYRYYRINSTITAGTLAFTAWITEGIYDLFFLYKWIELIMFDAGKKKDTKYNDAYLKYKADYDALWDSVVLTDDNGVVEESRPAQVRMGR